MMAQSSIVKQGEAYEQLRSIRANDEQVLKALYRENYPKVEAYILDNSGSKEQAKDIFQEAFIAVWRNIQLDQFQPENETSLNGYLYRVARNKWIDYLRSAHRNKIIQMNDVPEPATPELPAEENAYIAAVKKHFNELGDACREVLTRFYYRNESLRLIAKAMRWTEATARNNKYRCIQKLKELLNKNTRT